MSSIGFYDAPTRSPGMHWEGILSLMGGGLCPNIPLINGHYGFTLKSATGTNIMTPTVVSNAFNFQYQIR